MSGTHSTRDSPPLPYTSKRLIIRTNLSWKPSLKYEKPLLRTFFFIVKEHSITLWKFRSHIYLLFFQNTWNQRETQISESLRGIKSSSHKDKTKLNCQNQMKGYQSLQWLIRSQLRQQTLEVSSYLETKTKRLYTQALTKNLECPWRTKLALKEPVMLLWAQTDRACVFLAVSLSLWNRWLEKHYL